MTKLGLILILACSIIGGMFHLWNSHEKPPQPIAVAPSTLPPRATEIKPAVEFGPYMADLQRRIKRKWYPPKSNKTDKIIIVFKVHSNGQMSNIRLTKASSLAIANQAARKAVQNASPFRPLPKGAPDSVDIQFTFDYTVFKDSTNK